MNYYIKKMNYYIKLVIFIAIQLLIGFTPYHYSELVASVFSVYARSFFIGPTKFRENLKDLFGTRCKDGEKKKGIFRLLSDVLLTEEIFFVWEIFKHRWDFIKMIRIDNFYCWPLFFFCFLSAIQFTYPLLKRQFFRNVLQQLLRVCLFVFN